MNIRQSISNSYFGTYTVPLYVKPAYPTFVFPQSSLTYQHCFGLTMPRVSERSLPDSVRDDAKVLFPPRLGLSHARIARNSSQSLRDEFENLRRKILGHMLVLAGKRPVSGSHFSGAVSDDNCSGPEGSPGKETAYLRTSSEDGCEKPEPMIGKYAISKRQQKIAYYKQKLKKWRALHPISRKFEGRRGVALNKGRKDGKFGKSCKKVAFEAS